MRATAYGLLLLTLLTSGCGQVASPPLPESLIGEWLPVPADSYLVGEGWYLRNRDELTVPDPAWEEIRRNTEATAAAVKEIADAIAAGRDQQLRSR